MSELESLAIKEISWMIAAGSFETALWTYSQHRYSGVPGCLIPVLVHSQKRVDRTNSQGLSANETLSFSQFNGLR
jgi:hypothetical protein